MTVSLPQGGAGLGAVWGEQKALAMLAAAGFGDIRVKTVEGDNRQQLLLIAVRH